MSFTLDDHPYLVFYSPLFPALFLRLLAEKRPRALAIVATFIALQGFPAFATVWWLEDARTLVRCLEDLAGGAWSGVLEWATAVAGGSLSIQDALSTSRTCRESPKL